MYKCKVDLFHTFLNRTKVGLCFVKELFCSTCVCSDLFYIGIYMYNNHQKKVSVWDYQIRLYKLYSSLLTPYGSIEG